MLTNTHADRGRPTLKDDERFRNGLVRDLKETIVNTKLLMNAKIIPMNAKIIPMNAKLTKLNANANLNRSKLTKLNTTTNLNRSNPMNE